MFHRLLTLAALCAALWGCDQWGNLDLAGDTAGDLVGGAVIASAGMAGGM